MEPTLKTQMLHSIAKIFETSKECNLDFGMFTKLEDEFKCLSDYFKVSKIQCFFIANIFAINFQSNTTDMGDLVEHFGCNPVKLLELIDNIDELVEKGIVKKTKSSHRAVSFTGEQMKINEKITDAILKSQAIPELITDRFSDFFELLESLYNLSEQRDDGEIGTRHLLKQSLAIIKANQQYPLIQKLYAFSLNIWDTYVFLYMTRKTVSYEKRIDIKRMCEIIFDKAPESMKYSQSIISGENQLVKLDLIEILESTFFDDAEITLTDKSCMILNDCGIKLPLKKKNRKNILSPSDIPYRHLIFNHKEYKELNLLKGLLKEPGFNETRKQLESRQLPKGFAALFHGTPGTGKTETALQTGKETGRLIMKVDISQMKSMWFGESEKTIKRIFTDYSEFSKECEQTPILLFNEADAIFSKRRDIGISNTAQTENSIQNILLEELENFDGILIATTNMIKNLDNAFDRRFLFKICFEKPDIQSKTEIWKLKLPELSEAECIRLAKTFDFSGGQIDNIIRKYQIEGIIHQSDLCFDKILEFCQYENPGKDKKVIGFY
jgi:AAA+ superfamily predicted ATPase